jgi:hypothetical protein
VQRGLWLREIAPMPIYFVEKFPFNLSSTRKNIYSGVARKSLKQIEINVKRDVFSALFSWVPYFYASTLAIAW